ncbi:MAG: aminotransferase class III-fold pyridoxal phosphate-dependent enzyme [Gammaproteobacteria bacterium]|nr:aminotransferase class III-fold pyridoxal phosphate-dependent enzyme [Gammaproteobacteria bacterium]MDH3811610.1 aminotransferase class III-fold pyridoxal phosphate-dependent enzyme [Gammaproteobacteria bacterium]
MDALKQAIEDARTRFAAANPLSDAAEEDALRYLPGGNTRSVLHYEPFPLTMVSGEGAEVTDLDGHRYVDFVGEYSAGLFGHSDPRIKAAINEALDAGIAMGAPTKYERVLAALLCDRYPALEQVRFCNSGTEANLMALTTACAVTGRKKLLVFRESYHGGVIKFPGGRCELNVPYDFILADFNDIEGTAALIHGFGDDLAAVIVEPVLGAGGNIPGNQEFLNMLRSCTQEVGALLIFDEIKTARLGANGVQGMLDFMPDLTTVGKFIAGGLPTGAFGGRAELMARYDPRHGRGWNHAGTFNNNVCSMAAGCVAMGDVYTAERAAEFLEWSEAFRLSLNEMFAEKDVPMYANGMGSIIAIHFSKVPTKKPTDITAGCQSLRPLLHMEMLLEGVLICKRGDIFLSLPMEDSHLLKARIALEKFVDRFKPLIEQVLQG